MAAVENGDYRELQVARLGLGVSTRDRILDEESVNDGGQKVGPIVRPSFLIRESFSKEKILNFLITKFTSSFS